MQYGLSGKRRDHSGIRTRRQRAQYCRGRLGNRCYRFRTPPRTGFGRTGEELLLRTARSHPAPLQQARLLKVGQALSPANLIVVRGAGRGKRLPHSLLQRCLGRVWRVVLRPLVEWVHFAERFYQPASDARCFGWRGFLRCGRFRRGRRSAWRFHALGNRRRSSLFHSRGRRRHDRCGHGRNRVSAGDADGVIALGLARRLRRRCSAPTRYRHGLFDLWQRRRDRGNHNLRRW